MQTNQNPTPEEVEQVTRALMEALEHLSTSFDDLRNGYPESELHEQPEATRLRTEAALSSGREVLSRLGVLKPTSNRRLGR